jgi:exodeoxyribonuclease-1
MLEETNARRLGIDVATAEKNWQRLLQKVSEVSKKSQHAFDTSFDESPDADSALYQGFLPDNDRSVADQVRSADAEELKSRNFYFQDARLKELLFRYKARHYPQSLSPEERQIWREQVCERQQWPSRLDIHEQELATRISQETDEQRREILESLVKWARQRREIFCN